MPEKSYFVMATVFGGLRYLCVMSQASYSSWKFGHAVVIELYNPKLYVDAQQSPNPPRPVIVPMYLGGGPQKLLSVRSEILHSVEILGEIQDEAAATCTDSQELYLVYKDAVARWGALSAGVKSPTAEDIARVNRRGGHGPVVPK